MKPIRLWAGACFAWVGMSVAAHAAGSSVKAPPLDVPPAAVWDWSGFFAGAHTGAAWAPTDWTSDAGGSPAFQSDSVIGGGFIGGQAGYNWQTGPMLFGLELAGTWADISGFAKCATGLYVCNTKMDWFATATARVGIADGRLLYYGKGGIAAGHDQHRLTSAAFNNIYDGDKMRVGWTAGIGLEYAFSPAWSAFAEYDWLGFGTDSVTMTDQFGNTTGADIGQNVQLLKLGMNVRLGGETGAPAGGARQSGGAVQMLSEWSVTAGTRYWYSSGHMAKDLYAAGNPAQTNSRLTYGTESGHSLEGFLRFDRAGGLFIKGFLGFGAMTDGGNLLDEDFPPDTDPYSATDSVLKGDRLRYGGVDIGHTVWSGQAGKLGPFVGYRFMYQQANGYGCVQVATSSICSPAFPENELGLTETMTWRGVAVGLNGEARLTGRLTLLADLAYLPYVDLSAADNHWARRDINPQVESGNGWGVQVQALIRYALTPRWSIGVGGRYWLFETTAAQTRFPGSSEVSEEHLIAERYGAFVQSAYKFNASDLARGPATGAFAAGAAPAAADWRGFYAGVHAGGGWGTENWNAADSNILTLSGERFPASGTLNGVLAGGQIGLNFQKGPWVFGPEVRAGWSNFEGNAICAPMPGAGGSTVCNTKIGATGSATARLGRAAGRFLLYGKGGVAWAKDDYTLQLDDSFAFVGSAVRWGWTIGAGLDYALSRHWSLEAEYDYASFGGGDVTVTDARYGDASIDVDESLHLFTVGVNYRFGWKTGPFVTR